MKKLNIIIPTINRKDLLLEAIIPIDNQLNYFDELIIIDNGNQNIYQDIKNLHLVKENKLKLLEQSRNLGVAGSWNLGISMSKDKDFILFLNDDVVIGMDQLKTIHKNVLYKDFWLATGNCLWSMFLLSMHCCEYFLNKDSYVFDENFYPAYFEDNDFHYRLLLADKNKHIYSPEMNPIIFRNSMTIQKDPSLNFRFTHNQQYYIQKWGGTPGNEIYTKPFNA